MGQIYFRKYEGMGNDFILIDDRSSSFPSNKGQIKKFCDRKFGVGADGLILLKLDEKADFQMQIFNSDGSEAGACGNGLRCFARFIEDLGFIKKAYTISVGSRIVNVNFVGDLISAEMGSALHLKLNQQIGARHVHFVDTGVPHVVVFVPEVEEIDLEKEAHFLRHHPIFQPHGTNVNFATLSDHSIRVRTFERGVEGETLACGTGAAAVAVVAAALYQRKSPVRLLFRGGEIEIYLGKSGLSDLKMVGPARFVFEGKIDPS